MASSVIHWSNTVKLQGSPVRLQLPPDQSKGCHGTIGKLMGKVKML